MAATVAATLFGPSFFGLSGLTDRDYDQFVFLSRLHRYRNRTTWFMVTVVSVTAVIALALAPFAFAKRTAPAKVQPVVYDGVRYVAPNDDGSRGYIQAWEIKTNRKLWDLTVFTNRLDPKLEQDVQWVFVKSLSVRDGKLIVTSERGNTYDVDLNTKVVTQSNPLRPGSTDVTAQPNRIPKAAEKAIVAGPPPEDCNL